MLEMHEIRYFLALARERHFTRAAETCHVSQPAFTRAIRKMETKLGGLLFDRRRGQIDLTALGRTVMPQLQMGFDEIEAARLSALEQVKDSRTRLRIGVTCTISPDYFGRILKEIDTDIIEGDISLTEAKSGTIVDLLLADEIDVGIAAWPTYPDQVQAIPLFTERYAVAFAAGHVFAALPEVPLEQLSGESYLDRLACEFDAHFAAAAGVWPADVTTRFASEREDWIQSMIALGLGIAIVPELLPCAAGVEVRRICEPEISRKVSVLTSRGRRFSAPLDRLMRVIRKRMSGPPVSG